MSDKERGEILQLLAKGKITADEAADLLTQVERDSAELAEAVSVEGKSASAEMSGNESGDVAILKRSEAGAASGNDDKPRWLRIRVRDVGKDRYKVSVNLPLWLVSTGLGMAGAVGANIEGVDTDMLRQMIQEGERGILVDIEDHEDGEHVQIYLD